MRHSNNTDSPAATEAVAEAIGAHLRGGEVIELASDLGGGKTTFVRGLARGMASHDHVASPTFTISRQYESSELTLHHYDFYRLADAGIMANELHDVLHDPHAIVAVEWSDAIAHVLPEDRVRVIIERTADDGRRLSFDYPESLAYLWEQG